MITGTGESNASTEEQTLEAEDGETAPSEQDQWESENEEELPLDVVFDILKNRRRRLVLQYLVEVSETSTLSDLAEYIAAVENGKSAQALTSSERKRVYVCLYQCHLPKMDDAEIIEFENDRGTVELASNTGQLTQYLDTNEDDPEPDWPKFYAALAVIGGGIFVVHALFYPVNAVSGLLIGLFLGMFINLALEHAYDRGFLPSLADRRKALLGSN